MRPIVPELAMERHAAGHVPHPPFAAYLESRRELPFHGPKHKIDRCPSWKGRPAIDTFHSIAEAIDFAVTRLIPEGHAYIINIRGPREVESGQASALQILAQNFIRDDGDVGLAMHHTFDLRKPAARRLKAFLDELGEPLYEPFEIMNIPCVFIRMGRDRVMAEKIVRHILESGFQYPPDTQYLCDVYDEGPVSSESNHPAAPGDPGMG